MSRKIKKLILSLCIVAALMSSYVVYLFVTGFAFALIQGIEPTADMGDGYAIQFPEGIIMYYPSDEPWKRLLPLSVETFAFKDTWIVGKTMHGWSWYAINKKTNEVYYPASSRKQLEKMTKMDFSEIEICPNYRGIILERIVGFGLKEPWFIGRTGLGFFAINKKTHEVYYPASSLKKLENMAQTDFSDINLSSNWHSHYVLNPSTNKSMLIIKIILISLFLIFWLMILGEARLISKKKKPKIFDVYN
jgi:hypothetical protein